MRRRAFGRDNRTRRSICGQPENRLEPGRKAGSPSWSCLYIAFVQSMRLHQSIRRLLVVLWPPSGRFFRQAPRAPTRMRQGRQAGARTRVGDPRRTSRACAFSGVPSAQPSDVDRRVSGCAHMTKGPPRAVLRPPVSSSERTWQSLPDLPPQPIRPDDPADGQEFCPGAMRTSRPNAPAKTRKALEVPCSARNDPGRLGPNAATPTTLRGHDRLRRGAPQRCHKAERAPGGMSCVPSSRAAGDAKGTPSKSLAGAAFKGKPPTRRRPFVSTSCAASVASRRPSRSPRRPAGCEAGRRGRTAPRRRDHRRMDASGPVGLR